MESFRFIFKDFLNDLEGCEAFEGLESFSEIVSIQEVLHVLAELIMSFVMILFNSGLFEDSYAPLDRLSRGM